MVPNAFTTNTFLNPEYVYSEGFYVPDIFSIPIDFLRNHPLLQKDQPHMIKINMPENTTFDYISWKLYKTPKYWDTIAIINDKDPLYDLPFDYEALSDQIRAMADDYFNSSDYNGGLSNHIKDSTIFEIQKIQTLKNENNRILTVIKPNYIESIVSKVLDDIQELNQYQKEVE